MPNFRYDALDRDGNPVSGERSAAGADEVIAWLESQDLRLEWVRSADDEPRREPLRRHEAEEVSGRIGELMRSGLPLAPGLRALAAELPRGRYRRGLLEIAREFESGADPAAVLEWYGAPAELRALIRAGLRSGHAGEMLGQYLAHARSATALRHRAWLGLGYPLVLIGLAAIIFNAFLILVVPSFKKIFEDFGTELPGLTLLLVHLSDALREWGFWLVLIGVPLLIAVWLGLKALIGEVRYSRLTSHIPIIGPLWRWSALSRFSHMLSLLVESRVPLPEALVLAGESAGDPEVAHASRELAYSVRSGQPLSAPRALAGFPASFIQALAWEQNRKALPEALQAIGDMFEGRARLQSALVAAVSEPLIILLAGFLLLFLIAAMFMPLIKLLNDLS